LREAGQQNQNGEGVGTRVILSSTFTGGPRYMNDKYHDSVTIELRFGKPDLFITMTCNTHWSEIQQTLLPGQSASDKPDLLARVFKGYLAQFIDEVKNKRIFGRVGAMLYVIEFQKRGLPHAHILIILHADDKIRDADVVDKVVCAEIPPEGKLRTKVAKFMLHGICGQEKLDASCTEDGECTKEFPKEFMSATTFKDEQTYPCYRRRKPTDGGSTIVQNGVPYDNRRVVPCNPYLLMRFDCHINVEYCANIKACNYVYKYVYKGCDRTRVIEKNVDVTN